MFRSVKKTRRALPNSVFFLLILKRRRRRILWRWSLLIDCISLWMLVLLLIAFKLKAIRLTMAWLATVKAHTLISGLHVFGRLWHIANLHWNDVGIAILSGMEDSRLLLILSAVLLILSAVLELLNKLLFVHGGGEVKSNFSSFSCHDGIGNCCWLV